MKTLELSDENYNVLMELAKEYQIQDNDGNAFPYFWEPGSYRMEPNINGDGEDTFVYKNGDKYSLEEFSECEDELWASFCEWKDNLTSEAPDFEKYDDKYANDWKEYIADHDFDANVITFDWEWKTEHNPSLFKSDVENFCKYNAHHLGRNPHTYARTSFRMPKMEALVKVLCNINIQPNDKTDPEILSRGRT